MGITLNDGFLRGMGAASAPDEAFLAKVVDGLADGLDVEHDDSQLAQIADASALEVMCERYPTMVRIMQDQLAAGQSPAAVAAHLFGTLVAGDKKTDRSFWMLFFVSAAYGQLREWSESTEKGGDGA